eukprot:9177_1
MMKQKQQESKPQINDEENKEKDIKIPNDIYQIFPNLFLSSFPATKQYESLKAMKVTNIISVTNDPNDRPTEKHYKLFDVLYLPLSDEKGFDITTAIETISFYIHSLTKNNPKTKVLLNCSAGISRSASVIIGYCMIYKENMSLLKTYQYIKNIRKQIGPRPSFMEQLIKMEKKVFNVNESSLNIREYTINLLHEDTYQDKKKIGIVLDQCNGDYIKARGALFSSI